MIMLIKFPYAILVILKMDFSITIASTFKTTINFTSTSDLKRCRLLASILYCCLKSVFYTLPGLCLFNFGNFSESFGKSLWRLGPFWTASCLQVRKQVSQYLNFH